MLVWDKDVLEFYILSTHTPLFASTLCLGQYSALSCYCFIYSLVSASPALLTRCKSAMFQCHRDCEFILFLVKEIQ